MNCSSCGEPTTNLCARCGQIPYCNNDCREEDLHGHRSYYQDFQIEQQLHRVANILHAAFVTFRENTWSVNVDSVDVHDDYLVVHVDAEDIERQ